MKSVTTRFNGNFDQWYHGEYVTDLTVGDCGIIRRYTSLDRIIRAKINGGIHLGYDDEFPLLGSLTLVEDPENRYDPDAVSVSYDGRLIGWIERYKTDLFHKNNFQQDDEWGHIPKIINGKSWNVYFIGV